MNIVPPFETPSPAREAALQIVRGIVEGIRDKIAQRGRVPTKLEYTDVNTFMIVPSAVPVYAFHHVEKGVHGSAAAAVESRETWPMIEAEARAALEKHGLTVIGFKYYGTNQRIGGISGIYSFVIEDPNAAPNFRP